MITFPLTLGWTRIGGEDVMKEIKQSVLFMTLPNHPLNEGYEVPAEKRTRGGDGILQNGSGRTDRL